MAAAAGAGLSATAAAAEGATATAATAAAAETAAAGAVAEAGATWGTTAELGAVPWAAGGTSAASMLSYAGIASSLAGGVVQAAGAGQQARAGSGAAAYNAAVAEQNAQLAKKNSDLTSAAGEEAALQQGMRVRAAGAQIKAAQGAGGLDVNTGSNVDVQAGQAETGTQDIMTIRSNAARQAYGFDVAGSGYSAQAALDRYQGENIARSGAAGQVASYLGGASAAASQYSRWAKAKGGDGDLAII